MAKVDLAYAAGFFDGEGCIVITKYKDGHRTQFQMRVQMTNTDELVLRWLQELFGGRIRRRARNNPKWRQIFFWELSSCQAYDFLKKVQPYLRVKAGQAKVALDFQKRMRVRNALTEDERIFQEASHILMRSLNRGDISPEAS